MVKKKRQGKIYKFSFWQMMRDVLVTSMSKGLFLPACMFFIVLVSILKMPESDVSKLMFETFKGIESLSLVGYILSFFLSVGWFTHAKWQRRILGDEVKRIANERTDLQKLLANNNIDSSEE